MDDNAVPAETTGESSSPDNVPATPAPILPTVAGWTTAASMVAAPTAATNWVVPRFIARGATTLLDGSAKEGKTSFLAAALREVLRGGRFLEADTQQGAVLYLTEERDVTFQRTLVRAGLDSPSMYILQHDEVGGLPFEQVVDRVLAMTATTGATVVVIDTLARFAPGSDGNAAAVHAVFDQLGRLASAGLGVVALRHTRKAGGKVGQAGRGSGAASGAADIILQIEKCPGHSGSVRRLTSRSRFEETPESILVERTADGYVEVPDGAAAPARPEDAVLAVVPPDEDEALPVKTLCERAGVKRTKAYEFLAALVESGKVISLGEGTRNNGLRFYRAPPAEPSALEGAA